MNSEVYIIDDEEKILIPLEELLKDEGFEVNCFLDGSKALEKIKNHFPDHILLDVKMDELNGYDICHEIRALPDGDKVNIIMMTASNQEIDRIKSIALGANSFLSKPFSLDELKTAMEEQPLNNTNLN